MVNLFSLFGRPKSYKKRRSYKNTLARLTDMSLATAIATDIEVERQWLEEKYGINFNSENDPIVKLANTLRAQWTTEAIEVLGENEKTREATIRDLVDAIKKNNTVVKRIRDGNKQSKSGTMNGNAISGQKTEKRKNLRKEMIELIKDKEKNAGPITTINHIEEAKQFSEMIRRLAVVAKTGTKSQIIAVEINGKLVEMSPEAYQIFKKKREEIMAARARVKDLAIETNNNEPSPSKSTSADAEA